MVWLSNWVQWPIAPGRLAGLALGAAGLYVSDDRWQAKVGD